jgi:hypothetical protein
MMEFKEKRKEKLALISSLDKDVEDNRKILMKKINVIYPKMIYEICKTYGTMEYDKNFDDHRKFWRYEHDFEDRIRYRFRATLFCDDYEEANYTAIVEIFYLSNPLKNDLITDDWYYLFESNSYGVPKRYIVGAWEDLMFDLHSKCVEKFNETLLSTMDNKINHKKRLLERYKNRIENLKKFST